MKIKEHKTQILSALVLAFALGLLAMPNVVFAEEGTEAETSEQTEADVEAQTDNETSEQAEDGIEAQADNTTGEGKNAEDAEKTKADSGNVPFSDNIAENVVELYNRIQKNEGFADYKKNEDLVLLSAMVEMTNTKIKDLDGGEDFLKSVAEDQREEAAEMTLKDFVAEMKVEADKDESGALQEVVAALEKMIKDAEDALAKELGLSAGTSTPVQMVAEAKKRVGDNYPKYLTLLKSMVFIREAAGAEDELTMKGLTITKAQLETAFPADNKEKQAELTADYGEMLNAAIAIDSKVADGLVMLPTTSAPETPDSGIVGLIESGAMDLGTLTLIVSVAVAGLAGIGVIAKLYLKRKF